MSDSRRSDWESRYRDGRTHWDRGDSSPALHHWLQGGRIPAGRVLVPGCGNGHEIEDLVRAGCRVTAVDIAAQPVRRLRSRLNAQQLRAEVIQADLLHWNPAEPFDAIYEQTCLCALEPGHWGDYVGRLADWLLPDAPLFALFMQTHRGGGPPFHCAIEDMRSLFDGAHWRWPGTPPLRVDHPTGLVELGYELIRA